MEWKYIFFTSIHCCPVAIAFYYWEDNEFVKDNSQEA